MKLTLRFLVGASSGKKDKGSLAKAVGTTFITTVHTRHPKIHLSEIATYEKKNALRESVVTFPHVHREPFLELFFRRIPSVNEGNDANPVSSFFAYISPVRVTKLDEVFDQLLERVTDLKLNFATDRLWKLVAFKEKILAFVKSGKNL